MKNNLHTDPTIYKKFEITTADTNMQSYLMVGSLANLLIQSAISSADQLGFGFSSLKQHNLLWVLSRLNIEIINPLKWYDTAEVETWPKNVDRIFYYRDFIIRNQKNEIVAKATSAWLAIDADSRRPKILNQEQTQVFTKLKNKFAIETAPEKLCPIKGNEVAKQKASYFDIDLNQHVTATRYIDWMMDALPITFLKENYPKQLTINYLKETLYNEEVAIIKQDLPNEYVFEGNNLNTNNCAFRGKIVF